MANDQNLRWPRLKVREFMAPNAVAIQVESSLADVAETLAEYLGCDMTLKLPPTLDELRTTGDGT